MSAKPGEGHPTRIANIWLPLAVVAASCLCLWKVCRICSIEVHPKCVTVVYDRRRKTIFATSADRERKRGELSRAKYYNPLYYLSTFFMSINHSMIMIPPSSFYGAFTLPRSVLEPPGEAVECSIKDIKASDGAVEMVLTIRYVIPFDQLERYLAAVGPQPPNQAIAIAAAHVARIRCADISIGILISLTRREGVFTMVYRNHLAMKLMSELAVRLIDMKIENVELL
ncbi:unnamed protein product [Phytomonas sp. Hart1]|nr:unnamed protein product [Phytomonas sp. Hart1]|eukprot:CCW71278.1 unnamed protein product [Phytomonas sp. isolate Hart1]